MQHLSKENANTEEAEVQGDAEQGEGASGKGQRADEELYDKLDKKGGRVGH